MRKIILCLAFAGLTFGCTEQKTDAGHDHEGHDHAGHDHGTDKAAAPEAAKPAEGAEEAKPAEAAKTTYADVKPVFEKYCMGCHGDGGKRKARKHLDMAKTPFESHHDIKTEFKEVLVRDPETKLPKMPGGDKQKEITDEELALMIKWAEDGAMF